MKWFLNAGKTAFLPNAFKGDQKALQDFKKAFMEAEVFVFDYELVKNKIVNNKNHPGNESIAVALPFPVISIECMGHNALSTLIIDECKDDDSYRLVSLIAVELESFDEYMYYALISKYYEDKGGIRLKVLPVSKTSNSYTYDAITMLLSEYLKLLSKNKTTGIEKPKHTERISRKHNLKRKISRVIHISDRQYERDSDGPIRDIQWNHSWLVCGHWRRLKNPETLGLDRHGNRTVKGKTFIKPFKKGEGDLVRKVRIKK